jgi:hypothetical protein
MENEEFMAIVRQAFAMAKAEEKAKMEAVSLDRRVSVLEERVSALRSNESVQHGCLEGLTSRLEKLEGLLSVRSGLEEVAEAERARRKVLDVVAVSECGRVLHREPCGAPGSGQTAVFVMKDSLRNIPAACEDCRACTTENEPTVRWREEYKVVLCNDCAARRARKSASTVSQEPPKDEKRVCPLCGKEGDWTFQSELKVCCHYGSDNDQMYIDFSTVCPDCIDHLVKLIRGSWHKVEWKNYLGR